MFDSSGLLNFLINGPLVTGVFNDAVNAAESNAGTNTLLLETGDNYLLETGSKILLENQ